MARRQQLQKGVAGTLVIENAARPSAATVTVYDYLGTVLVSNAAATIDTASTTVAGWSSAAPRSLTLTAVTGFAVNRNYRLRLVDGQTHTVRIVGINTGAKTVSLQDDPSITPAVGAYLEGLRVSYAVGATLLPAYGEGYRAEWTLTVDSVATKTEQIFDCVHSPARNPATAAGLRRHKPGLTSLWDQISTVHTWDDQVQSAYEQILDDLETQMLEEGHALAYAIVDWDQLERCIYERVLKDNAETLMPKNWDGYPESWLQTRREEYSDAMGRFYRGIRYVDPDQTRTKAVRAENRPTVLRH